MDRSDLYSLAIKKFGWQSQVEMIEEECLELALALQKLKRVGGRAISAKRYGDVIDEIADVEIMIEQAHQLFDPDEIEARKQFKLKRLEKRLDS